MKIGIVGASIAGASLAILLSRLGHDIHVFEKRGANTMDDLGAGIVLPSDLIDQLKQADLFDADFPALPISERIFLRKNQHHAETISSIGLQASAINWRILYTQLAKRLTNILVNYDTKVTDIHKENHQIILNLADQRQVNFDKVIFADGYRSLGRHYLFPNIKPTFTDYTCWQGNFISAEPKVRTLIGNNAHYYLYEKGILLAYAIPNDLVDDNTTTITWFFYEKTDQQHPLAKDNKLHTNIYQDAMQANYLDYLHHLADKYLPDFGKQIVKETKKPFTHAIFDTMVPSYQNDNITLIGDAGILLRPHLGSGATKALQDSLYLAHSLNRNSTPEQAFIDFSQTRQQTAANLFGLSRAFGDFLVASPPDWKTISGNELINAWNNICEGYQWYQQNTK